MVGGYYTGEKIGGDRQEGGENITGGTNEFLKREGSRHRREIKDALFLRVEGRIMGEIFGTDETDPARVMAWINHDSEANRRVLRMVVRAHIKRFFQSQRECFDEGGHFVSERCVLEAENSIFQGVLEELQLGYPSLFTGRWEDK